MSELVTVEMPIRGMDCPECTEHVRHAIAGLPGVASVEVFLAAEKATVRLDPSRVDVSAIRRAVAAVGYSAPEMPAPDAAFRSDFGRRTDIMLAGLFVAVLLAVIVGEGLDVFASINAAFPLPVGLIAVLAAGLPVFRNVARAALRGQIIAHTLMTLGVLAALAVGQWVTALLVVGFMRVGDYVERFTTDRARRAIRDLSALAPQTARIERDGREVETPIAAVQPDDLVIVRPGEQIPVDGEVVSGEATVDQAAITGEGLPVEAGPGAYVYAATFVRLGHLRIRAARVGPATTFGRVIRLVEEAEAQRAHVQRAADRLAAWYLPVVAGLAGLTFLLRGDPLATAAVLVVACSCSFALATPIAMLASIAAGARRGLLVKGGRYLELLARADVALIDKTGTVTLGKPQVTDVIPAPGRHWPTDDPDMSCHDPRSIILRLAASAERYSEHPLAEAIRAAARAGNLTLADPLDFEVLPGLGVRATVDGRRVTVGNRRLAGLAEEKQPIRAVPQAGAANLDGIEPAGSPESAFAETLAALARVGKTLLFVAADGDLLGVIAMADTLREDAPAAVAALRDLGVRHVELLTGDHEQAAATIATALAIPYRASLLPEDKIRIVREYQAAGHIVMMIGDGINDAPALAQADVGIAMATSGSDIAVEAAPVALMRDDWMLVPLLLRTARRTMRVVRINLAFAVLYNVVGLSLAALGLLPPVLAAAAQSLPDLGILGNSARLLRDRVPS